MQIVPIVEGHGDVEAVPLLLRRILQAEGVPHVRVPRPIRCPRTKITRPGELERCVRLAHAQSDEEAGVLILLDADEECPAHLAPVLHKRASQALPRTPVSVVLAKMEYESWFLAALDTLRGVRGIRRDVLPPADPEAIRGAKEYLSSLREKGVYAETVDQPAFTAQFGIQEARQRSPSFDKLWREVVWLCRELERGMGL